MSHLQLTVFYLPLRMVRSVHQCSAKPSQKTSPNGTFSERLSPETGRTVFLLLFDGDINVIPALLSAFLHPADGFFVAVNGRSIHPDWQPRIPSLSVRLLGRANADWWILPLRKTQLWRDWIRQGWCVHWLLVIFSTVVPTQIALQINIAVNIFKYMVSKYIVKYWQFIVFFFHFYDAGSVYIMFIYSRSFLLLCSCAMVPILSIKNALNQLSNRSKLILTL